MTEAEWMVCADPEPMLEFLKGKASERKLRLYALACCRRFWHLFDDDYGRPAVESAERCAEGMMSVDELWAMWNEHDLSFNYDLHAHVARSIGADPATIRAAFFAAGLSMGMTGWRQVIDSTSRAALLAARLGLGRRIEEFADEEQEGHEQKFEQAVKPFTTAEKIAQVVLLRDAFGNPFRPVAFDPNWLTSDVVAMARGMYETRDFAAMPILADALQDAGCENADVLNHCRGPGPHVRGCWVVDLVLGKE